MIGTYIGFIFGYVNLLIIYPLYLRPDEVGLMRIFLDLGLVLGPLGLLGSERSIMRFFPVFKMRDEQGYSGLVSLYLFIVSFGVSIVCLVYWFNQEWLITIFGKNMPEILAYGTLIPFLIIAIAFRDFFDVVNTTKGRIAFPTFFREVILRFGYFVAVLLFGFKIIDFEGILLVIIGITVANAILSLAYLKSLGIRFFGDFSFFFKDKKLRKEFVDFSTFQLVMGFALIFINKIDFFMLGSMSGASQAGIYTIAFYLAAVVSIPSRSLLQIAYPITADLIRRNEDDELKVLYQDSSINMIILSGFIFLAIWINLDLVFNIMPNGNEYVAGKNVVFFIGLAYLIQVSSGIGGAIMGNSKYYKFTILYSLGAIIIAIISNLILIPILGLIGAALGTLFTQVVLIIVINGINKWKRGCWPYTNKTIQSALIFAALFGLNAIFPPIYNVFVTSIIKSIIILSLGVWFTYYLQLSPHLNKLADQALELMSSLINRRK